jgi:Tol biopolymer transport system component
MQAQFYNGSQTDFGKNRVQYQDFKWNYYRFDKYEVYFNTGGKELAIYVARAAKLHLAEVEKIFDYSLDDRIQFVVYNKQEDFKQSNVGLTNDDQQNVGGYTRIVGRKVFLYYEGDHVRLEEQIRGGIAEILINQMMYGGNTRDMLKSSTLLNLPEWYVKGLVSYVAKGWNADIDNRVRDGIMSGRYKKFNHLTGEDAVYAGHSIWYYIAEKYGPGVIPNILYMTKVSRNVESAFLFVLGVNMRVLTIEWMNYYSQRYSMNDTTRTVPTSPLVVKPKATRVYSQAKISPDGRYITYVTNEMGQTKLWLENLGTHKRKRLLKMGHRIDRINDYSYPLLAWHPSGQILSWIYEKEGETFLVIYTIETGEKIVKPLVNFIKVLDYSYSPDGKSFVMSAVQRGQTDIYVYSIAGGGAIPVTNDVFDDLNPRFVNNGKGIIFSSNRNSDTLGIVSKDTKLRTSFDLFIYNWKTKDDVLRRLTNTPGINELQAAAWDSTNFCFVSDQNGVRNRYVGYFDSTIAYVDTVAHYRYFARSIPITNYKSGILEQDVQPEAGKYAEILFIDGRYRIFIHNMEAFDKLQAAKLKNTAHRNRMIELVRIDAELDSLEKVKANQPKKTTKNEPVPQNKTLVPPPPVKTDSSGAKVNIDNYQFGQPKRSSSIDANIPPPPKLEAPKDTTTKAPVVKTVPDTTLRDSVVKAPIDEFLLPIARNYKIQYSTEYVVSQLDNSFLNAGYQRFTGGSSPIFLNPGFTGLFKIGITDLLEDHKIVGGVRLSGDLKNNEYIIQYDDRTRRLDRTLLLHRQAFLSVANGGTLSKIHTQEGRYGLRWPFSEVASLRGQIGYRNDRRIFLSQDFNTLNSKNTYNNSANLKIEFVFDNTIRRGLNLYNGIRLKVFAETFQGVDSLFKVTIPSNRFLKNDLYVVGFDVRMYKKIHREFIWATRISGATSFGREKLVYYMGAVDNWLTPKFDQSVYVADDMNYTYQTLVTPMRGFYQNIRNGNSFLMINSELRFPVFRYLFNRPMRSDFLNNFQVIGFGDVGTAWTGPNPYDPRNSLNTTIIGAPGNPITVVLKNHKEPIVAGYGVGLRTRIWGYFVRVDWAWGLEDRLVLPRVTYLSFSMDF